MRESASRVPAAVPTEVDRKQLMAGGLLQLLAPDELLATRLQAMAGARRGITRGTQLYRCGDRLNSLHIVDGGMFKTCVLHQDGRSQVTGFQLSGDWLGIDGIGTGEHQCDAVALSDAQVCSIAYGELEDLLAASTDLRQQFQRMLGRQIVRCQEMMTLLGGMSAEKRLAHFLLDLARRIEARGGPPSQLVLNMTRDEIGSCLGLKLETVSRMFSRLRAAGVLEVTHKQVRLVDLPALQRIAHASRAARTTDMTAAGAGSQPPARRTL